MTIQGKAILSTTKMTQHPEITQMVPDKLIKTVKPHGNSCAVLVPKSWEGKRVIVSIIPEKKI